MLDSLAKALDSFQLNHRVLETAFELYLQAPPDSHPLINLRDVSKRTGVGLLECRNTIVTANKLGRFPNCSLAS